MHTDGRCVSMAYESKISTSKKEEESERSERTATGKAYSSFCSFVFVKSKETIGVAN